MISTVGHSTRTVEALVELLRAHGIRNLADVRTLPRSRRNPQFDADALPEPLAGAGIRYTHLPELGGLRRAHPDSPNTAWRDPGSAATPTTCRLPCSRPRSTGSSRWRRGRRPPSCAPRPCPSAATVCCSPTPSSPVASRSCTSGPWTPRTRTRSRPRPGSTARA